MKRFEIYERETDIYICFKNTREEALKCIRLFELHDSINHVYKPNSFIIKEVEDTYATEILNNLFSNFNNTFSNNLN